MYISQTSKSNIKFVITSKNVNIFKTIWFNFRALPFRSAIKLPFVVGRRVKILDIGEIRVKCEIEPAMFTLGVRYNAWETFKESQTVFKNEGTIELNGYTNFYAGNKIFVARGANLSFGSYNNIGYKTKIICYKRIEFGNNTGSSWECEFFDTNFHNMKDIVSNRILKKTAKVVIGDGTFIGNNSSIHKGVRIPPDSIICSFSRVSGSYAHKGNNLLIQGNPATIADSGYKMLIREFKDYED